MKKSLEHISYEVGLTEIGLFSLKKSMCVRGEGDRARHSAMSTN